MPILTKIGYANFKRKEMAVFKTDRTKVPEL